MDLASKQEVARKLEVSPHRPSNYENGESEPTLMELLVYARFVGVSMNSMVDDAISVDSFRELLGKPKRRTRSKHK